MAIVQNPIIGRAKGSLANTVFSTWKGQNIIKSKAISPTNPNTTSQQVQRGLFAKSVEIVRFLAPVISFLYSLKATSMTTFNYATKTVTTFFNKATGAINYATFNADSFIVGDSLTATIDATASVTAGQVILDIDVNFAQSVIERLGVVFYIVYMRASDKFVAISEPEALVQNGANLSLVLDRNTGDAYEGLTANSSIWAFFYDSTTKKIGQVGYYRV